MELTAKGLVLWLFLLALNFARADCEDTTTTTYFFAGFQNQEIKDFTPGPNSKLTWVIYGRVNAKLCVNVYWAQLAKDDAFQLWEHPTDDLSQGRLLKSYRPGWEEDIPPFCTWNMTISMAFTTDATDNSRGFRAIYYAENPSTFVPTTIAPGIMSWPQRHFLYATVDHQWILYKRTEAMKNASWIIENRDSKNEMMCVYLTMVQANPGVCLSVWENQSEDPDVGNSLGASCDTKAQPFNVAICSKTSFMSVHLHDPLQDPMSFHLIYYIKAESSATPVRKLYGSSQEQILTYADISYQNVTWLLTGRKNTLLCIYLNKALLRGSEELSIWENDNKDAWNGHALKVLDANANELGPFCTWTGFMSIHYITASLGNDQTFTVTYYMGKEHHLLYAAQQYQWIAYDRLQENHEIKQDIVFTIESKDITDGIMCVDFGWLEMPKGDCISVSAQHNQHPAEVNLLAASCDLRLHALTGPICRWTNRMNVQYNISVSNATAGFRLTYYVKGRAPAVRKLYASKDIQRFSYDGRWEEFDNVSWIAVGQMNTQLCFDLERTQMFETDEVQIWENFDDNPNNGRILKVLTADDPDSFFFCTLLGYMSLHYYTTANDNPEPFALSYYMLDAVLPSSKHYDLFAMYERQLLNVKSATSTSKETWFIYGRVNARLCMYFVSTVLANGDGLELSEHNVDNVEQGSVLKSFLSGENLGPFCTLARFMSLQLTTGGGSSDIRSVKVFYYVEKQSEIATTPSMMTVPIDETAELRYLFAAFQNYQLTSYIRKADSTTFSNITWLIESKNSQKEPLCVGLAMSVLTADDCLSIWENHSDDPQDRHVVAVSCNFQFQPLEGPYCSRTKYMSVHYTTTRVEPGPALVRISYYVDRRAEPVRKLYASLDEQHIFFEDEQEPYKNVTWLISGGTALPLCIFIDKADIYGGVEEVAIWENNKEDSLDGHIVKVLKEYAENQGPFCSLTGFMSVHYTTGSFDNPKALEFYYYLDASKLSTTPAPVTQLPATSQRYYYAAYDFQEVEYDRGSEGVPKEDSFVWVFENKDTSDVMCVRFTFYKFNVPNGDCISLWQSDNDNPQGGDLVSETCDHSYLIPSELYCNSTRYMFLRYTSSSPDRVSFFMKYYQDKSSAPLVRAHYASFDVQTFLIKTKEPKTATWLAYGRSNSQLCMLFPLVVLGPAESLTIWEHGEPDPAKGTLLRDVKKGVVENIGPICTLLGYMSIQLQSTGTAGFGVQYYLSEIAPTGMPVTETTPIPVVVERKYVYASYEHQLIYYNYNFLNQTKNDAIYVVENKNPEKFLCLVVLNANFISLGDCFSIWENANEDPNSGNLFAETCDISFFNGPYCTRSVYMSFHFKPKSPDFTNLAIEYYWDGDQPPLVRELFSTYDLQDMGPDIEKPEQITWLFSAQSKGQICVLFKQLQSVSDVLTISENEDSDPSNGRVLHSFPNGSQTDVGPFCTLKEHMSLHYEPKSSEEAPLRFILTHYMTEIPIVPKRYYANYDPQIAYYDFSDEGKVKENATFLFENKGMKGLMCLMIMNFAFGPMGDCILIRESDIEDPRSGDVLTENCALSPRDGPHCTAKRYASFHYIANFDYRLLLEVEYDVKGVAPPLREVYASYDLQTMIPEPRSGENITWIIIGEENVGLCIFFKRGGAGVGEELTVWENYDRDPRHGEILHTFEPGVVERNVGPFCTSFIYMSIHFTTTTANPYKPEGFDLQYILIKPEIPTTTPALPTTGTEPGPITTRPKHYYAAYEHQAATYEYKENEGQTKENAIWLFENKAKTNAMCMMFAILSMEKGDCLKIWESDFEDLESGDVILDTCSTNLFMGPYCTRGTFLKFRYIALLPYAVTIQAEYFLEGDAPPLQDLYASYDVQEIMPDLHAHSEITWMFTGQKDVLLCIFFKAANVSAAEQLVVWQNTKYDQISGHVVHTFHEGSQMDVGPFCTLTGYMSIHFTSHSDKKPEGFYATYFMTGAGGITTTASIATETTSAPVIVRPQYYYAAFDHQMVFYDYQSENQTKENATWIFVNKDLVDKMCVLLYHMATGRGDCLTVRQGHTEEDSETGPLLEKTCDLDSFSGPFCTYSPFMSLKYNVIYPYFSFLQAEYYYYYEPDMLPPMRDLYASYDPQVFAPDLLPSNDVMWIAIDERRAYLCMLFKMTNLTAAEDLTVWENDKYDPISGHVIYTFHEGVERDVGPFCTQTGYMSIHFSSHSPDVKPEGFYVSYFLTDEGPVTTPPLPTTVTPTIPAKYYYASFDRQVSLYRYVADDGGIKENAYWIIENKERIGNMCLELPHVMVSNNDCISIHESDTTDPAAAKVLAASCSLEVAPFDGPLCSSRRYIFIRIITNTRFSLIFQTVYYKTAEIVPTLRNIHPSYDVQEFLSEPQNITWLAIGRPDVFSCLEFHYVGLSAGEELTIWENTKQDVFSGRPVYIFPKGREGNNARFCSSSGYISLHYVVTTPPRIYVGFQLRYYLTQRPRFPWPRDDVLQGFWPLDEIHEMREQTGLQRRCMTCKGTLDIDRSGPFGRLATSYSRRDALGAAILDYRNFPNTITNSVTVTFFINAPKAAEGGVLAMGETIYDNLNVRIIQDGRPKLQIYGPSSDEIYGTYDVLQPNEWTFIAVILESSTSPHCTLSINGRFGTIYKDEIKSTVCENLSKTKNLLLGFAQPAGYLSPDVSLSCLSLYADALSTVEIRAVHDACRAAHGTPPCGSPVLPLSPLPDGEATIPEYGQFPWIASLKKKLTRKNVLCAASILDRYFLLTSASCFKEATSPNEFVVNIAEYDARNEDAYEKEHAVRQFYVHPVVDIAIIELATPIDFQSDYINSICLPQGDTSHFTGKGFYFYGWGVNGRPTSVTEVLPRYVKGNLERNDACSAAYPTDYQSNATACFESVQTDARDVPCRGDEGGPVMLPLKDVLRRPYLLPVATYTKRGANCAESTPALVTMIGPYLNWIEETIACILPGHSYPKTCPVVRA